MKIGFSFWGFLAPIEKNTFVNTPDGVRGDRVDFVNEMLGRGHEVVRLQQQRDAEPYDGVQQDSSGFPDLDLLYCEWRWPTWKNTGPNPSESDYSRQVALLDHYHKIGTPIVIHDGDLKLTGEEEQRWPNAIVTDPCIDSRFITRERIFVPWVSTLKRVCDPCEYSYNYTYVGNNYERDQQFSTYYAGPSSDLRSRGIQTLVYGNWLQRSPERKDPRTTVSSYPSVSFGGRISYKDIFPALASSIAVTHITKDEYASTGNITLRFYEAIQSSVPALIPDEYTRAKPVGLDGLLVVKSSRDVVEKLDWLSRLSLRERTKLVDDQERAIRSIIDPTPGSRVDLIEHIVKNGVSDL